MLHGLGTTRHVDLAQQVTAFQQMIRRIISRFYSLKAFNSREIDAVKEAKYLKRDSLYWLARSINIGSYQRPTLRIIIKAILQLPTQELLNVNKHTVPWRSIFEILYEPFLEKREQVTYSIEEQEVVILCMRSLASIGQEFFTSEEFSHIFRLFYGHWITSENMCAILAHWRQFESRVGGKDLVPRSTVAESYRYCVSNWWDHPWEFSIVILENTLNSIKQGTLLSFSDVLGPVNQKGDIMTATSTVIPERILNLILEIIALTLDPSTSSEGTSISTYLSSMERAFLAAGQSTEEDIEDAIIWAHASILRHLMFRFYQRHELSTIIPTAVSASLSTMRRMVQSPIWDKIAHTEQLPLLFSMHKTSLNLWSEEHRRCSAEIIALALPTHWNFKDDDWSTWWTQIILGFGDFVEMGSGVIDLQLPLLQDIVVNNAQRILSAGLPPGRGFNRDQINQLKGIPNPLVRLLAAVVTQSTDIVTIIPSMTEKSSNFGPWGYFIEYCYQYHVGNGGELSVAFLRAFTIMGSLDLYSHIYDKHISTLPEVSCLLFLRIR